MIKLMAGTRLAAATDNNGAIAHITDILKKYGIEVKRAQLAGRKGEPHLHFECKAPYGQVSFSIQVEEKGSLFLNILDTKGLEAPVPDYEPDFDFASLLEKNGKVLKTLKDYMSELDKTEKQAREYADGITACRTWMTHFIAALRKIESTIE